MQIEICCDSATSCERIQFVLTGFLEKKKIIPQSQYSFHRLYLWRKLAFQIGHKRISTSLMHYAMTSKKCGKNSLWKKLENALKSCGCCRTKVSFFLGALQCILINLRIMYLSRQNTPGKFEYVPACSRSDFSVLVLIALI